MIIFDTETGGTDLRHPTIQIGAIAVDQNWREIASFERKIQFDVSACDPEALSMNCYAGREAEWRFAVEPGIAMFEFANFLKRHADVTKFAKKSGKPYKVSRLCGHNIASFDLPRVSADCRAMSIFFPGDFACLDSLQLYRWVKFMRGAHAESGKLSDIAKHYGVDCGDAHDAVIDCRIVAKVVPLLLSDCKEAALC